MENFFNVPLVLKDYKDLIPEDYDDLEYYGVNQLKVSSF